MNQPQNHNTRSQRLNTRLQKHLFYHNTSFLVPGNVMFLFRINKLTLMQDMNLSFLYLIIMFI